MIVLGALLTGIAIGFRTQNAMLTVPLLAGLLIDRIGRGFAPALVGSTVALTVGSLLWAVPLILASGGVDAYLAALGVQAGEDFAGGEMLYLNPAPRLVAIALARTFIYPWDSLVLGGVVTALAALGAIVLLLRDRRSLAAVALVAIPYLAFHLVFQDTSFVRYALPLMAPVAFLAVRGLEGVTPRLALPVAGVLTIWSVVVATPSAVAYGSEPSPTAQAVAAMEARRDSTPPGALAMHQTFQRPIEAEALDIEPRLPSPPRREWLELVRYWREGATAPLWFLADPRRSDLALFDPQSRRDHSDFGWTFSSLSQIGGMRPFAVSWYRMPPPGWFAEEGWALTPETAGMARLAGRGPSIAPDHRVGAPPARCGARGDRRAPSRVSRGCAGACSPPALDEAEVARWEAPPGFFLHEFELPAGALAGTGAAGAADDRVTRAEAAVRGHGDRAVRSADARHADVGVSTRDGTRRNTTRASACGAGPRRPRRCGSSRRPRPVAVTAARRAAASLFRRRSEGAGDRRRSDAWRDRLPHGTAVERDGSARRAAGGGRPRHDSHRSHVRASRSRAASPISVTSVCVF